MTPGLYTAANAMEARFRAQEAIAKNLSGSQTIGFRKQIPIFKGYVGEDSSEKPDGRVLAGVQVDSAHWDFTPGSLRMTGRELDFAIRGDAFFVLDTPHGIRLTRDGHFMVDDTGQLISPDGFPVLGEEGPISLPEGEISVDKDGGVNVDGQSAGQLRLEWAKNIHQLVSEGGGRFNAPPSALEAASGAEVVNGSLEMSNVVMPLEMVNMLQNSRMAENASRALKIVSDSLGTAVQELAR